MTAKERFFATLSFEKTDRTPSYVLDGSSWVINEEGMSYTDLFALEDVGASLIVKRFDEIQSDLVTAGASCWLAWANAFGAEIVTSKVGRTIEVLPCMKNLETDLVELTDEELKTKLYENIYIQKMVKQLKETKKLVGEEKPVISCLCGPFTAAGNLMGTGEFMLQIAKRNKKLPELLELTTRIITELAKLYYESGADVFLIAEPTSSGDMIAPRTFTKQVVPYFKKFMENLNGEIPIILHICGKAGKRVDEVKELGVKAFSVDSMVDMEEMLAKVEKKICMMGNLAPADQMVHGTPESVYAEATRLLTLAEQNGGGFLLSTGCDYPAGASAENARSMTKAAIDFANK